MPRTFVKRVLHPNRDEMIKRIVPTRGVVEMRLYDFDSQQYRYMPGLRVPCVVTSEQELRKLWALIERVVTVHEDHWRDPKGLAELTVQEQAL